ncbi:MAG: hypothetical protein R3192_03765 [Woeseiaceae bacterium]|nr:hypothetical protein [Woeseiaceae bacterium]
MDSPAQSKRVTVAGMSLLAAILMLGNATHAASNAVVNCDQVGRDLQSVAVTVADIGADNADHTPLDSDIVDDSVDISESVAPILKLGPRVTNILRDVFGTEHEQSALEQSSPDASPQTSFSPLADRDGKEEIGEADDAAADESELPRFQLLMRRTDI